MAEYREIAGSFSVSTFKSYFGPVVLAEDAFFLVPMKDQTSQAVASQFGLIGMLVNWLATRNKEIGVKHDLAVGMDNIPPEILEDPNWPVKTHRGTIMLIPKAMVTELKFPWWGGLTVKTEKYKVTITPSMFGRGKVKQALADFGWQL